ncbi:hypothetical protein K461DRAFT_310532 [Myriangium duriaei CBS 260.36]|uniref:Protein kinase domain-containing protein n=1 Tax=Myriangium duriaei CBS 260.36 TaxID=1168546 RepID=A0A9P4J9L4_9PEZI|nr:hypothetical protein K461DRAFT_310532 [Myriangium duriaei CBS 260.36]
MPSTRSQTKEDTAPTCHVLEYSYNDDKDDDRFAMTALVHTLRFHISVDPVELKSKDIRDEYLSLLDTVRGKEQPGADPVNSKKRKRDASSSNEADSGYGGSSPASPANRSATSTSSSVTLADDDREDPEGPIRQLQNWTLEAFGDIFASRAPADEERRPKTVAEWFHGPVFFYDLTCTPDGTLTPSERTNPSQSLRDHIATLVPSLQLPKYITTHSIPIFSTTDLHIEGTSSTPSPLHPAVVRSSRTSESYFLKLIDPTQPGPAKRELRILKDLERKNIHQKIRVPLVLGVVVDDHHSTSSLPDTTTKDAPCTILGFLLTPIASPTPLTTMLDTDVAESHRERWARQVRNYVDELHAHGIIWGDAKADNFLVDEKQELWIIDFGGSYTEGWIEEKYSETEKGDEMGTEKVVAAVRDPEGATFDPDEEEEGKEGEETKVAKLQHEDSEDEEGDNEEEDEDVDDELDENYEDEDEDTGRASKMRKLHHDDE